MIGELRSQSMSAVISDRADALEALIETGEMDNSQMGAALYLAVVGKCENCVALLLKSGADIGMILTNSILLLERSRTAHRRPDA